MGPRSFKSICRIGLGTAAVAATVSASILIIPNLGEGTSLVADGPPQPRAEHLAFGGGVNSQIRAVNHSEAKIDRRPVKPTARDGIVFNLKPGKEQSISSKALGVPNYSADLVRLRLEAPSGILPTDSISVLPKGAEHASDVQQKNVGSLVAVTEAGIDGEFLVINSGTKPVTLVASVLDWVPADRAVPAKSEDKFIEEAIALGSTRWMAEMAIWDAELAATLPTSATLSDSNSDVSESVETTSTPATDMAFESGASETSSVATAFYSTSAVGSVVPTTAENGTCAGDYRLGSYGRTVDYTNWMGNRLWSVDFKKRFCFNPKKNVVATTDWSLSTPRFTTLGSSAWVYRGVDPEVNNYVTWGGNAKGSHRTVQKNLLTHCSVKPVICRNDMTYRYAIRGNGDGSKTVTWTD